MKSSKSYKNQYELKNKFINVFNPFKKIFIISLLFLFFGFLFGIFICINRTENLELEDCFCKTFISYLSRESSNWSLFLNLIITFSFQTLFIFLTNFNVFFIICDYTLITINGYIIGYNTVCIVTLFPVLGIITSLIFYILILLICNILLCFIFAIAFKKYCIIKKYGSICSKENNSNLTRLVFITLALIIIILFIQCLLIFIVGATVVL